MDNLVASLSRYTQLLNPTAAKPAIAFGESAKARLAAEAVFTIANQCALLFHLVYCAVGLHADCQLHLPADKMKLPCSMLTSAARLMHALFCQEFLLHAHHAWRQPSVDSNKT